MRRSSRRSSGGLEGLFASAENGTLFLDELGELNKDLQGQLLRVLQDGEYQMVGSSEIHKVKNVRIIAATNRDLVKMVQEGSFREDLYHRLNVVQIRMKGLRERPEDIAEIANGLLYRDTRNRLSSVSWGAVKDMVATGCSKLPPLTYYAVRNIMRV